MNRERPIHMKKIDRILPDYLLNVYLAQKPQNVALATVHVHFSITNRAKHFMYVIF